MAALPMFPLGTVLLPGAYLSLHVFEPRYRALVEACLDGTPEFGVALIERGSEVGGGDVRFDVGTQARIADSVELDDGRWVVAVVGEARVRVQRWLPDDPYPRAEVLPCAETAFTEDAASRRDELERVLWRVVASRVELGEPTAKLPAGLSTDALVATWQAVALSGLGPLDAQRVLETDGAGERLDLVLELLRDEDDVLAQRLAAG